MTRSVVFLAATLLFASLGSVAQNNSAPSGGQSTTVQASAPTQSTTQPAAPSSPASAGQGSTTAAHGNGIQNSAQGQDPRAVSSSAELPQTSTILPLLGLIGLGSLIAGLFARR